MPGGTVRRQIVRLRTAGIHGQFAGRDAGEEGGGGGFAGGGVVNEAEGGVVGGLVV